MPPVRPPTHLAASASASVRDLVGGPSRPAAVLGRFATALYLRLDSGEVVALLSSDAVGLPIGLVLPTSSRELPLTRLSGPAVVGSGAVHIGSVSCSVSRLVSHQAPPALTPDRHAAENLRDRLTARQHADGDLGVPAAGWTRAHSRAEVVDLVSRLLGVGPGLTPAGDDILAGLLVGVWSFGLAAEPLRSAVLASAPVGTTDLSASLLRCAARGESIPEVHELLRAVSTSARRGRLDPALAELLRVGHSSGTALATGVSAAAGLAIRACGRRSPESSIG